MSGSGPIYEYQRELTAKLEQVMRERDEARAEVERLREALRDVAERQREACAGAAYTAMSLHPEPSPRSQFRAAVTDAIDATPLVTEE